VPVPMPEGRKRLRLGCVPADENTTIRTPVMSYIAGGNTSASMVIGFLPAMGFNPGRGSLVVQKSEAFSPKITEPKHPFSPFQLLRSCECRSCLDTATWRTCHTDEGSLLGKGANERAGQDPWTMKRWCIHQRLYGF